MKSSFFFSLPVMALFLAVAPSALADTMLYVNGVNGNDDKTCLSPETACKTIGHAISLASSGDSIIVAPAIYTENLTIAINLNIIGSGASTTIIDGGGAGRVVTNSGLVHLSQITIRHGYTESGNPVAVYGGGMYNSGTLTIDKSIVSGNATQCFRGWVCPSWGGGIYNAGLLTITNSTISGNAAIGHLGGSQGGGIYNRYSLTITNSTISGNGAGRGGGIYNSGGLTINSSTISGNNGGGIFGSATWQNSIVANGANNCSGRVSSNGYNLSSDKTCNFSGPGDLNNIDPKLGPLQNNGGPTQTQALLSGSPAIDAGNPSGCTDGQGNLLKTDQRGMPRPDHEDKSGCDMGAYESQSD
ncbi:MAG: hypothetical protein JO270_14670 [Acidobacteriaceae bacterium]|nr:hypothetical protein [Acidobacteriaceae bacterium]